MTVVDAKERAEPELMAIEGVEGVGASTVTDEIIVYVRDESVIPRVPSSFGGYPIRVEVSGQMRPLGE